MKKFISSNGLKIFVGQNSKENTNLSLKLSKPDDIFFHVSDFPGSHVVIQVIDMPPLRADLMDAACLAAYFSKARNRKNINVDYTECKHLSKPRKAPSGTVELAKFKTLKVKSSDTRIAKYIK